MARGEGGEVPAAPTCVEEFTKSWAEFVLGRWLADQERGAEGLDVTKVNAVLNSQQVQLDSIAVSLFVDRETAMLSRYSPLILSVG